LEALRILADQFRKERGLEGGLVVFWDNVVTGWICDLQNPKGWRPGCMAIPANDSPVYEGVYYTVGGNHQDGSKEWKGSAV